MNPHAKPSNSSAERKRQSIEQVRGGVGAALPVGHAVNQGESVGQIEILLGMEKCSLALYEHRKCGAGWNGSSHTWLPSCSRSYKQWWRWLEPVEICWARPFQRQSLGRALSRKS